MDLMTDYQLYLGDCLEVMPTLEANSADVIFTDPPYPYIRREYGYWAEETWIPMMQEVVRQSRRILKPHGSMVVILQPNSEKVGKIRPWLWKFMAWCCEEWNMVQDAYWWNYTALPLGGAPSMGLMRPSIKLCIWLGSAQCYRDQRNVLWQESDWTKSRRLSDRANGVKSLKYTTPSGHNMNKLAGRGAAEKNGGTTPFNLIPIQPDGFRKSGNEDSNGAGTPLALTDWWLRYLSKPGDVVLDPFAGTSTTGVAALKLGRKYIGIERVAEYIEISRDRLDRATAEPKQLALEVTA